MRRNASVAERVSARGDKWVCQERHANRTLQVLLYQGHLGVQGCTHTENIFILFPVEICIRTRGSLPRTRR